MFRRQHATVIVALFMGLTGCASLPEMTAVGLDVTKGQDLIGYWEGRWSADNGSGGIFEVDIIEVAPDGKVSGDRMYVTQKYGANMRETFGMITNGKLHLDTEKGPKNLIEMELFHEDGSGDLWLRGRYSVQGGNNVYLGSVYAKKKKTRY